MSIESRSGVNSNGVYRVNHKDGTQSFLGELTRLDKNRPFAFHNASTPLEEDKVLATVKNMPLPFRQLPEEIIGWGGHSVCLRLSKEGERFVAVLRSNRDPENSENFSERCEKEKRINTSFNRYSAPQDLVVVEGFGGHPAVMKISREVSGAPLNQVSSEYLFYNRQLIEDYLNIAKITLIDFIKTGNLTDLIGHIQQNRFIGLLQRHGLFFFDSSNLMVDFETNHLVLVDSEPEDISKVSLRRKVQLIFRALGTGVNIALLEVLKGAHKIRDKLVFEPVRKEDVDKLEGIEEYKFGLSKAITLLEQSGVDYRIVGSLATAAAINNSGGDFYLSPYLQNRSVRDIDVLLVGPVDGSFFNLVNEFNTRRSKYFPIISLSIPECEDENLVSEPGSFSTSFSNISVDYTGNTRLKFRGDSMSIPQEYLDPVIINYEGIKFPTLDARVLAGLYLTRIGIFKAKDIEKVTELLKRTGAKIPTEFLDFSTHVRKNHKKPYRNTTIREMVYYFSCGLVKPGTLTRFKKWCRA